MNRAIGARLAVLISIGLVAVAVLFFWHPWRPAPAAADRRAQRAGLRADLGGETVLLEIYSSEGSRLWLLNLRQVEVAKDDAISATGVRAEFYGTSPASRLASPGILYRPDRAAISFHGGIHLSGPEFDLSGSELTWDERARSFTLSGGYVLTRAGTRMEGDRLWADQDFQTVKALGAVRLRSDITP